MKRFDWWSFLMVLGIFVGIAAAIGLLYLIGIWVKAATGSEMWQVVSVFGVLVVFLAIAAGFTTDRSDTVNEEYWRSGGH